MNIFEDGPYEVGGETDHDESLVPVPANSYLGRSEQRPHTCPLRLCATLPPRAYRLRAGQVGEPGAWAHVQPDSLVM